MIGYNLEFTIGVLGLVCMLIMLWIIIIHLRVNRLKLDLDEIEKMIKG